MAYTKNKTPGGILDYGFDWEAWLEGDTISSSDWDIISPPDNVLTISLETVHTTTASSVRVTGGTVGAIYRLRNRIITASGEQEDRTLSIRIAEK